MDAIIQAINNVITFISEIPAWFLDLFKNMVTALFEMLGDVGAFIIDKLLLGVLNIINSFTFDSTIYNATSYLNGAPAEFLGMLVAIRIPEALAIIVAALLIRFALGLIPFVRVGR